MAAFALPLSADSVLAAEIYALHFALSWCLRVALMPTLIEVDASLVITYLAAPVTKRPWALREVIAGILNCIQSLNATVVHILREANSVADSLASFGLTLHNCIYFYSFDSLPPRTQSCVLSDSRGLTSANKISKKYIYIYLVTLLPRS